ncbi:MAG TPA: GTPase HflX [Desulfitobacteriaceae bacterium]|nr:GTPase HflX [Desulfitobacteriaceae bacterium]
MDITGDLSGIRTSQIRELQKLCDLKTERHKLVNSDLANGLARTTRTWNREIAVFILRSGDVFAVSVGQHAGVHLPVIERRKSAKLRCIHTHPNGNSALSTLDLSALSDLGLESIASLGIREGKVCGIQLAYKQEGKTEILNLAPAMLEDFNYSQITQKVRSPVPKEETFSHSAQERAFLVGLPDSKEDNEQHFLDELRELSLTAGVKVVGELLQSRRFSQAGSYLGKGKLEEACKLIQEKEATVLICDDELSPRQLRTLEQAAGIKVLDRTALILDIFSLRARSKEGKLQVELAQLKHLLPYLTGQGYTLSRLGGGVGTRGPGESKLELDRRRVRKRISQLEQELLIVQQERSVQRQKRLKSGIPLIALVGYTNAGKTTFMQKAMEQAGNNIGIPAGENQLFATLDPIIRRIRLVNGRDILLSDTVGFIKKLPHKLLKAFLATLEEVQQADVLVHILDASHPQAINQALTVHDVLKELGCESKPIVTVLNKTDKITNEFELTRLAQQVANPEAISLLRGDSLTAIWERIVQFIPVDNFTN